MRGRLGPVAESPHYPTPGINGDRCGFPHPHRPENPSEGGETKMMRKTFVTLSVASVLAMAAAAPVAAQQSNPCEIGRASCRERV